MRILPPILIAAALAAAIFFYLAKREPLATGAPQAHSELGNTESIKPAQRTQLDRSDQTENTEPATDERLADTTLIELSEGAQLLAELPQPLAASFPIQTPEYEAWYKLP